MQSFNAVVRNEVWMHKDYLQDQKTCKNILLSRVYIRTRCYSVMFVNIFEKVRNAQTVLHCRLN